MAPYVEILGRSDVEDCYGPIKVGFHMRIMYIDAVDSQLVESIRYVRLFPDNEVHDEYWEFEADSFPEFPSGDWNYIDLVRDEDNDTLAFSNGRRVNLYQDIEPWHPLSIDYLDVEKVYPIEGDGSDDPDHSECWMVEHDLFPSPIIMKTGNILGQRGINEMKVETASYRYIDEFGIAPKFLAHVTENGQIIGFLTEAVKDGRPVEGLQDYEACKKTLQRLHDHGFAHPFPEQDNFIISPDGTAVILDFGLSERVDPAIRKERFEWDFKMLHLLFM